MNPFGKTGIRGFNTGGQMYSSERYSRQIMLAEIGEEGQRLLGQTSVLVVGAGGLGSPILSYLAAAGIGSIGIIDNDVVSISNLQRQVLYTVEDLGKSKAQIAQQRLHALNPDIELSAFSERLTQQNATTLFKHYQIIVDACDNYETRRIIDEETHRLHQPFVHGSICGFIGQASVFNYKKGKRYVDLFTDTESADDISPVAVIGPIAGIIGSIEALQVIKIALSLPDTLDGKLLQFDLLKNDFQLFSISQET